MSSSLSKPPIGLAAATDAASNAFAQASHTPLDCHFHVFSAHYAVPGARYRPAYAAALVDWAAAAQACGVRRGLLVQPSFLGTDNSLLLQTLRNSAQSLRGVVVLAPDVDPAQLSGWHAQGVRGLRLNVAGISHDLRAWQGATALWQSMLRLGWHLELHTDQGALPAVLAQLHNALPGGMRLVLDHFAKPAAVSAQDPSVQAVRQWVAAGGEVHVKLSGSYRLGGLDAAALARLWLAELGPQRLLWGSDWPCTNFEAQADYAQLHGSLQHWLGDDVVVQQVLCANPHRLLAT